MNTRQQLDSAGYGSYHLFGTFTGTRRIKRRVLVAAQCLARELDQVVRDEADSKQRLYLSALDGLPRHSPEWAAIIGQDADSKQQIYEQSCTTPEVGSREAPMWRRSQSMRISGVELIPKA
jgi:hypothetical protein